MTTTAQSAKSALKLVQTASLWRDRWVILFLCLAILVNAAAFGYVIWRYPALPQYLPLHYNAQGDVDYIGTRAESFKIPAIGLATWLANTIFGLLVHDRERLAGRLLAVAATAAQLIVLAAAVAIVR